MKKILIIEDEESMLAWMRALLKTHDYEVCFAQDGQAGVQRAILEKPDLIVSDIMMDNLNGFMVREELQSNPATKTIPFIFMTGAADAAGAWGSEDDVVYLLKPFSTSDLLAAVRRQLALVRG
jgi:CheY-like chemotaxis protein